MECLTDETQCCSNIATLTVENIGCTYVIFTGNCAQNPRQQITKSRNEGVFAPYACVMLSRWFVFVNRLQLHVHIHYDELI